LAQWVQVIKAARAGVVVAQRYKLARLGKPVALVVVVAEAVGAEVWGKTPALAARAARAALATLWW